MGTMLTSGPQAGVVDAPAPDYGVQASRFHGTTRSLALFVEDYQCTCSSPLPSAETSCSSPSLRRSTGENMRRKVAGYSQVSSIFLMKL